MNIDKEIMHKKMLQFTLSLYNNLSLSRKAVEQIIQDFNNFISDLFIPFVQNQVETELKSVMNVSLRSKVKFILENNKNIFGEFSTEYLRFQMYEEESLYIPPQLITIDSNKDSLQLHVGKEAPAHIAYIPLKDNLEKVFSVPGMFEQIEMYVNSLSSKNSQTLSNFIEGELWQKKYKNQNKIVYPLFIYYDDFETRNPLGSHAGEQKMGGLYASLACLPPHLVAKLENIFVCTIVHTKTFKKYGPKKVFAKTIEDLNDLCENGITININEKLQKVFFECVLVVGDNLALNTICGFSGSFVANHYCRICMATNSQCRQMIRENEALIRTKDSYELDLLKNDFQNTGIQTECPFNKLKNFHIAENIAVDVMHDVYEGIASYAISKILQSLIKKKILSLGILNNAIDKFPYNQIEKKNKPRRIDFCQGKKGQDKLKIKQSASEMLCLIRYLGLMLANMNIIISKENEEWKLYLYLRQIIGILTSPKLDKGQMENVQTIIEKFNCLYIKLFGKLKPKMHFWGHYARVMLLNGPVANFSSMKYERKNKNLKEAAEGSKSNINVPMTIAIRHQLQQCYNFECCSITEGDVHLGQVNKEDETEYFVRITNTNPSRPIKTLRQVEVLGKPFSVKTIFVTRITDTGPHFGILLNIFYDSEVLLFYAQEFTTNYFDKYNHAYNVNSCINKSIMLNVHSLPRFPPCLMVTIDGKEFISCRYDL